MYTFKVMKFVLIMTFLFLVPPFIFVVYDTSSLAVGLLISSLFIMMILYDRIGEISKKNVHSFLLIMILLCASATVSFSLYQETKPFVSVLIILPMLAAFLISKELYNSKSEEVLFSIKIFVLLLLFLGSVNMVWNFSPYHYSKLEKGVFPFYEQSHYALTIGLLSFPVVLLSTWRYSFFVTLSIGCMGILFPNLTLVVFSIMLTPLMFVRLGNKYYYLLFAIFSLAIMSIGILFLYSTDYFLQRISFIDGDNLTALVYVQGWQLLITSIKETYGVGLGFQMLGSIVTPDVPATSTILDIYEKNFNLEDGGFLAAKLISEFGLLGALSITAYLVLFFGFYIFAPSIYERIMDRDMIMMLIAIVSLAGFFVEIMFRGYGYFSPCFIWTMSMGLCWLNYFQRVESNE